MPWIKSGINKFIPSVIKQPVPQIPRTMKLLAGGATIVDAGAGGRRISDSVICLDAVSMANTDVVGNIHALPFKNASLDCVICTGVMEHIEDPCAAMKEINRVIKPGGIVHLEVPFIQPYHRDPQDYWRWTMDGLRLFALRHGFNEIRSGALIGPASAMNAIIIAFYQGWFRSRVLRKGIDVVLSFLLFPFKFLDFMLLRISFDMPSAVYYVGKKPAKS